MRACFALIIAFVSFAASAAPANSNQLPLEENTTREFVMSCTYGVMAGTLVGAASLAFTSQPSDNLNRVARGASIGLYAGILLGLYVIYIVPGLEAGPEEEPVVMLAPRFTEHNKMDGFQADWTVLKF
jgi:hypothetical protein